MSGVIQLEGHGGDVLHPQIGRVKTDVKVRRECKDFPPLVWFTRRTEIPNVLLNVELFVEDKLGRRLSVEETREIANGIAMHRVALGFPISDIPVVPWPEYPGHNTPEGQALNESAREVGDNPNEWYVSETPVDIMKVSEFWNSLSISKPKMERRNSYVADIKRMVTLCREKKGVYIPPTWMKPEHAHMLAKRHNVPVIDVHRL
jgi:hypothetical protein